MTGGSKTVAPSRQRVQATLDFSGPDRLPRDVWGWRYISRFRPAEWKEFLHRFPMDFSRAPSVLGPSTRASGTDTEPGTRVDEWGSVWTALGIGAIGEVSQPVLHDWEGLAAFSPPWDMLEHHQVENVNAFCRTSDGFVLGEIGPGPFERLQFLRGSAGVFLDIGEQSRELGRLMEVVHEFYRQHMALWCRSAVDAITLGDDWGGQTALLISPEVWRRLFRPLYAEYFALAHAAGKRVFFHSDGMIREIIPDLIEIGVDALNSQLFCMDIEEIGRSFRGHVTFWGEIDRQFVLPFGTVDEVRQAVRRVRAALEDADGGLIAQLSWGIDDPLANILAAYEEWHA